MLPVLEMDLKGIKSNQITLLEDRCCRRRGMTLDSSHAAGEMFCFIMDGNLTVLLGVITEKKTVTAIFNLFLEAIDF